MGQKNISVPQEAIAEFCRRNGIRRLALYGSVLSNRFRPESDVDVLIEFREGERAGFLAMARMSRELSTLFGGRPVDLRTPAELSRYFRTPWRVRPRPSMESKDLIRVRHMLDAAREASGFIQGLTRGDLEKNG